MPTTWQYDFFRDVALDCWRAALPHLPTRAEADFLAHIFNNGEHLLDLASGNGRHAFELASRGFRVTGVDLSEEFIRESESHNVERTRFVCADMLDLPLALDGGPFDGAYSFGNSICHFDGADLGSFLSRVASVLNPGAAFVIDTGAVAESLFPAFPKGRWMRFGDLFMLSEHRYDPLAGRLDVDYTFIRGGLPVTRRACMFVFTLSELSRMFEGAGFAIEGAFSTPGREPYAVGSPRLLLVTRRR